MSGVTFLKSPINDHDEDVNLGGGQSRLAQEVEEEKRHFMEVFDHVSRIDESLSFLEKRVLRIK